MSFLWWTSVAVFVAVFAQGFGAAKCETTAFPIIPSHLLECYMDDGIYHRANRMPNSFESFVDLLKKLESSPTSRSMNARELATALLHYLKLDGIQSIRSHMKYFPSNILPFAPSGSEYFKHRLTLVGLVPRIDSSYMTSFNETLTKKEMCNLHFMLSYSIDPYKREDERCSPLFEKSRRGMALEPSSEWDSYPRARGYRKRSRRHVDCGETSNRVKTNHWGKRILRKRSSSGVKTEDSEVEEIPVRGRKGEAPRDEKDKFTIGDQELLSGGEERFGQGMQSLVQAGNFGRFGGRPYSRTPHFAEDNLYSGVIPGIPLSDCPVVNGVVTMPFGSLTIGTVIAGIAAGLNPEDIPPMKLSVDPAELESPSDRVKNTWATTLAGTIADTISSSALLDANSLQVLKGGWNDSSELSWYLLESNQFRHMTEVSLRGSLDGLLLGLNAKELTSRFPNFKLSQMLETYYDCFWGTLGAKYRVQLRSKYAPEDVLRKQVYLMSLVLKKQKTNVLTVLDYSHIAKDAVDKVIQHIQTMDDNDKSYIGSFLSTKIDNSVNMIAVIDSSWGYQTLNYLFQRLRSAQVAATVGNNLTVVCGKDGKVIVSSENSADFHSLFTKDMLLENCTRGLDFPLILDTLDTTYRKLFYEEKMSLKMNTDSQVAVLFPFDSLLRENAEYVAEKSRNFRNNFPDVRLMVVANGRSESFLPLLNSSKDLFTLLPLSSDPKSANEFVEGVKKSYQRISRPSCGSYFDDDSAGTETRITRDVRPGNVAYYRLLPQYFYTQRGQATVTIRSKLRAPLTVCHSREMERPAGPTPRGGYDSDREPKARNFPPEVSPYGESPVPHWLTGMQSEAEGAVECKTITSEAYTIELENPCGGASSLKECNPLYVSLTAPLQETVSIVCMNCRLPVNVQYEISVNGLTCYNSAGTFLLSSLLFCLVFIRNFV